MTRKELEKPLNTRGERDQEGEEEVLTGTSPNIPTSSLIGTVSPDHREEEVIAEDTEDR